ncbi:MAG: hypothetical protein KDC36_04945 [Thermoleophilia bacterium]|nr:hypothetical protein [Thermoleophilia bacterium]
MSEIPIGKRFSESNNNARDYALKNADEFRQLLQTRSTGDDRQASEV